MPDRPAGGSLPPVTLADLVIALKDAARGGPDLIFHGAEAELLLAALEQRDPTGAYASRRAEALQHVAGLLRGNAVRLDSDGDGENARAWEQVRVGLALAFPETFPTAD